MDVYITAGGHDASQCFADTALYWDDFFMNVFQRQVNINGSGITQLYGLVQRDFYCPSTPNAPVNSNSSNTYRQVNSVRPSCGSGYSLDNNTLALGLDTLDLACGDQVYIHGHGVKVITDQCPACTKFQLDNYTTSDNNCSAAIDLAVSAKTIKLLP